MKVLVDVQAVENCSDPVLGSLVRTLYIALGCFGLLSTKWTFDLLRPQLPRFHSCRGEHPNECPGMLQAAACKGRCQETINLIHTISLRPLLCNSFTFFHSKQPVKAVDSFSEHSFNGDL